MRNGLLKKLAAIFCVVSLVSSCGWSQEKSYVTTHSQWVELKTIIAGQNQKLSEQERKLEDAERKLEDAEESVQRLELELSEQSKSLKKSETSRMLGEIKVGCVSFGLGFGAGIIFYNYWRWNK